MPTKPLVRGTIVRYALNRAQNANVAARKALTQMIDIANDRQDRKLLGLISIAALALGENLEALNDIERITRNAPDVVNEPENGNNHKKLEPGEAAGGARRDFAAG